MAPLTPLTLPSLLILATPSILILIALYVAVHWLLVHEEYTPLAKLPVPPGRFWSAVGHLPDLFDPDVTPQKHELYTSLYGLNFQHYGFGPWDKRLFTLDPTVAKHVLEKQDKYQKGWQARAYIDQAIGEGGLTMAEGESHHEMRRILNPVFNKRNLDALLPPIAMLKAQELCSKWASLLPSSSPSSEAAEIEVTAWLTRATFDVIGLAGFGYAFDALTSESNPLYVAFQHLFSRIEGFSFRMYLGVHVPAIDTYFPDERVRAIRRCRALIDGKVTGWIADRRAELGGYTEPRKGPKDLLTLMIKEIDSPKHPSPSRLPIADAQIISQINTFLLAGSETTALALSWTLYYLSTHPEVQGALRAECASVDAGREGVWGEVDRLVLLERVVRETLRLTPPVHSTLRRAMVDDNVSFSSPPLPLPHHPHAGPVGVSVPQGSFVHIPFEGFNTHRAYWGADALEFRPERWAQVPDVVRGMGMWAGLWSFSCGPKACIGRVFALIEIKLFVFFLVRTFEFECRHRIVKRNEMLTRPIVDGENERGQRLPLLVRLVKPAAAKVS